MRNKKTNSFFPRVEEEIENYLDGRIEISPGVDHSQYRLINRIYKFRNKDMGEGKINADLSYNFYFDIISPRAESEIKNLKFDSKNIMIFSRNPQKDFAPVYIANTQLANWMAENGEDDKLKSSVEEFTSNGTIIFKKLGKSYITTKPYNTFITNTAAESINDTSIIERHEMTASQMLAMEDWDQDMVRKVIEELGNKTFQTSELGDDIETTNPRFEIYEYTGEVSEQEYNEVSKSGEGDEHTYFGAKIIVAGLRQGGGGGKFTLFHEKFGSNEKMDDYYKDVHRGRYDGRFWRVGMYELLFDHQIRANEIGNQLARALEMASKTIYKSSDVNLMENIRADLDNGDVIITDNIEQLSVRSDALDQLIADWNRLMQDADQIANSSELGRGESPPSGTPFRLGVLMDQNNGKFFSFIRQKFTLPYKRVFKEWILPELIKDLTAEQIFRITGDMDMIEQFREVAVESWYSQNLVQIGLHSKDTAKAIKEEKLEEMRESDPTIENSKEIWKGVKKRLHITITGENSNVEDQMQDLINLVGLEQDPDRINWILDNIYRSRNIPIPPRPEKEPPEQQDPNQSDPSQVVSPEQEQQRATQRATQQNQQVIV